MNKRVDLTMSDIWALLNYGHIHASKNIIIGLVITKGYKQNKKDLMSMLRHMTKTTHTAECIELNDKSLREVCIC